ncbi:hypothetical protein [Phenylobacterium sp.]|uniref:hypothetical protein n=1 Tax=Phenylobacterium sp. TaxID=1871053 RepID=UPI0037C4F126
MIVILLAPLGLWAVRFARRQRGGAVMMTSLMLVFGMNIQITPPPPPRAEYVQQVRKDDEKPE